MSISPACQNAIAKVKRNAVRISGVNGIRALSRCIGINDDYSAEFVKCTFFVSRLESFGIHLSDAEQAALWQWLDRTAEGIVCPAEFITALRHIESPYRRSMVSRVLKSFRRDEEGNISTVDIRGRFAADRHPQVIRGEKTEKEVREHIDIVFSTDANSTGSISPSELEQYFAGLSAIVDTDERFAAILRGCWCLLHFNESVTWRMSREPDGDTGLSCHLTADEKNQVLLRATRHKALNDTISAHRLYLIRQRAGFRALGTALRRADEQMTGFVSKTDFFEALASVRLYADQKDLFDILDVNDDNTLDYDWYMHQIVGELPPARRLAAERLWREMPLDRDGCVDLIWFHKHYVALDATELSTFYDAWDQRHASASPLGDKRVSEFEFTGEWLVPISARIVKDVDFTKKLDMNWPLQNSHSNASAGTIQSH